jgi:hypothetical protein
VKLKLEFKRNDNQEKKLISEDIDEEIRNRSGYIRRKFAKSVFNQGKINYDDVTAIYDKWRNTAEYIVLRGVRQYKQLMLNGGFYSNIGEYVYRFVKASKRGNDVYRYLIKKKFKQFEKIEDIEFFKDEFGRKKTELLFITMTYDTKVSSPIESWYKIPKLFNNFKANITKQYGKIKTFRVWEATQGYYAHIHCLIYFEEKEFEVFPHINKNKEKTYRMPIYEVNKIKKYYPYNIDIQACQSFDKALKEVLKYIGKYLIKETKENKPTKTNAMIWITNKQGYSISKNFFNAVIGKNIEVKEPKATDLTSEMCNSNLEDIEWEYIGLISGEELKISGKIWVFELKKPPPYIMEKIEFLINEKICRF